MRIAILGTRGIPNNYGGFEQLAEYLSVGLATQGHEVFVYCSSLHSFKENNYKGVNLIHCYDPENRIGTAGQFLYDLNCIIDSRKRRFDVILQLGYTSSSVWHFLLPGKPKIITNMDGLEWKRTKYSNKVQSFLIRAESWAVQSSNVLVADSPAIKNYLEEKYKKQATFIAYGADAFVADDDECLQKYHVKPNQYSLLIARFEPENNIELIIKGYLLSGKQEPLLVIGSFNTKYGKLLKSEYEGNAQIRFVGPVYSINDLNYLRFYCQLYFHGHSVGGTNPSLLEAMACGAIICAHSNPFNKAVLENDAFFFEEENALAVFIKEHAFANEDWRKNNLKKIAEHYNWNKIIFQYEALFISSLKNG